MPGGICACWPTKRSNWAIVNTFPTRRWARFSKNALKPHLKRTWCIGQLDSRFLARMEHLLALYALPYDPAYPVVCYDERPCFLIGDTVEPRALQSGQVRKEHYAYAKLGACALRAAIEPLTGKRLAQVHAQRTKRAYTQFCQALAAQYPTAVKIRLVQDNLNTHVLYFPLTSNEWWANGTGQSQSLADGTFASSVSRPVQAAE